MAFLRSASRSCIRVAHPNGGGGGGGADDDDALVVAFSSCLDVAAIEMDMGKQLDVNYELGEVVGWSNFFSGITGGFTGSYIFSQTIFTYRTCRNRIVGVIVIISEFGVVIMPGTYVVGEWVGGSRGVSV